MPTTTTLGYPAPLDSDPVSDGALAVRDLAQAVDDKIGVLACGEATVNVSASSTGFIDIVFPVGRFSATPIMVATCRRGDYVASVSLPTASGFRLSVRQIDSASATLSVLTNWIAIQQ